MTLGHDKEGDEWQPGEKGSGSVAAPADSGEQDRCPALVGGGVGSGAARQRGYV